MKKHPNRRDFLKTMATTAAGVQFFGLLNPSAKASQLPSQMNLLIILTDQERPMSMWFPQEWEEDNLPNMMRLKNNGLTFNKSFCATAMCSPSRASLMTGLYPAQHHTPWTLTEDFEQTPKEHQLDPSLPNMATCLKEAGYDVIYKGKWHLSHGTHGPDGEWIEDDLSRYGFDGWEGPDAGGDTRINNFGGGTAAHDQRFIDQATAFMRTRIQEQHQNPNAKPFCLIVSLVNPHDVLAYPGIPNDDGIPPYVEGGYGDPSWLAATTPPISLPPTIDEHLLLNHKPTAHANIKLIMAAGLGSIADPTVQQNYLNFYGNLLKFVDSQIGQLLDVFDEEGPAGAAARDRTLIVRTSDHGENGLCHGGLRQKTFVAYEETLRIPLVWSNPVLFPTARTTESLVSHVDLLPTLCALTGVPNWQNKGFAGIEYSELITNPLAASVQDYVLFAYDDIYAASNAATFPDGSVSPPNCLRAIRTQDFKYVRYFDSRDIDPEDKAPDQEEFYDLRENGGDYDASYGLPLEEKNLSQWAQDKRIHPISMTQEQEDARTLLKSQLATLEATRLAPRGYAASEEPDTLRLEVKRWTDPDEGAQSAVQITFYSRLNTVYQLERSTDLVSWNDLGTPVAGNGGIIVMSEPITAEKAFYRIQWQAAS